MHFPILLAQFQGVLQLYIWWGVLGVIAIVSIIGAVISYFYKRHFMPWFLLVAVVCALLAPFVIFIIVTL